MGKGKKGGATPTPQAVPPPAEDVYLKSRPNDSFSPQPPTSFDLDPTVNVFKPKVHLDILLKSVDHFSGKASDWSQWSRCLVALLRGFGIGQYFEWVDTDPNPDTWPEELFLDRDTNSLLFNLLSLVLDNEGEAIIRNTCQGNGMFAWQAMRMRFRGSVTVQITSLLNKLIHVCWQSSNESIDSYVA